VIAQWRSGVLWTSLWLLAGCNSDVPVVATVHIAPGIDVTVQRVATHPFLARFNLTLVVRSADGCVAASDLFPDTGGVSRRNLYRGPADRLYVIGQFDVRRFDLHRCRIELMEFRSVESGLLYVGAFDADPSGRWGFSTSDMRPERPFAPL
jgi:hypothetical protein